MVRGGMGWEGEKWDGKKKWDGKERNGMVRGEMKWLG